MHALVAYLDLLGGEDLAELRLDLPSGEVKVGYFDNLEALTSAVAANAQLGQLTLGAQSRPQRLLRRAPNKLRSGINPTIPEELTYFSTVVVHVSHDDDGMIDSSTVATQIVERIGGKAFGWKTSGDLCQVLLAVPRIELHDRDDLIEQLTRYGSRLKAAFPDYPDAEIFAQSDLVGGIKLNGGAAFHQAERVELVKLGALLHRAIPVAVTQIINRTRGGRVSKMFRGEGSIGVDAYGRDTARTPENYDKAFVLSLVEKLKEVTREDLINALWNRPGCAAKTSGIDAVIAVVDTVLDETKALRDATTASTGQSQGNGIPVRTMPEYAAEVPLRDRLYHDYLEYSDRAGRWVWRADVEISYKADKVVQFLLDNNAEFYHFRGTYETVFVLDGHQYAVDTKDPAFQAWFTNNVRMFGPNTIRGRELTSALRVAIESHEDCHKPENSNWGHFDRTNSILYFCFDPQHAEIVRVQCGHGMTPQVDIIANGTDEVTLRGPLGRKRRFEYQSGALAKGFAMFREDVHCGQALEELDRLMSTVFNIATLIPDLNQRPIKFHTGSQGSGKTNAAYDWQDTIYGDRYSTDFNDKPSLLHAIKHGGPFITQDNAEAVNRRKFSQVYLVASTGSTHTLRKYYTESSPVIFEPNGTLCLSAIELMAKPEEVRRTFEFCFAQRHHTQGRSEEKKRADRIQQNSNLMLSAILEAISIYVLPDWEERHDRAVQFIENECPKTSKIAFKGWLGWMLLLAESIGLYLWDPARGGMGFDARVIFYRYMSDLAASERSARVESDQAIQCLEHIRNVALEAIRMDPGFRTLTCTAFVYGGMQVQRQPNGVISIGPVTTSAMYRAFTQTCRATGDRIQYENGRALGARLRALAEDPAFAEHGWTREQLPGRGHNNNHRYLYTFTPENLIDVGEPLDPGDIDLTPPVGALGEDDSWETTPEDAEAALHGD